MRLVELEPRWIHPSVFVFRCPHCRKDFLSCKNVVMSSQAQWDLFEATFGKYFNMIVVGCEDDTAWEFSGTDFATLTIKPSLDASKSGHWHGNITNGEIC